MSRVRARARPRNPIRGEVSEGGRSAPPRLERLRLPVEVGDVLEARVLGQEYDLDRADRPVPLFADDEFGDVGLVRWQVFLVRRWPIEEEDQVRVLFQGAALAKIAELRPEVAGGARFDRSRELRQRDDRDGQLLGERLERSRNLGDLLLATFHRRATTHELKVVDHDEVEAVLRLHAARLGPRLEHGEAGAVVDEDRRLAQPAGGGREPMPVGSGQAPRAHRLRVHLGFRAEHALHELRRRHLKAQDQYLAVERDTDVLRDVQREGRLAHAGAAGDDHEVRRLQARGLQVELLEARGHASDVLLSLVQPLDVLERVAEDLADWQRAALESPLGEPEDTALGVVDEGLHVLLCLECLTDDLRGRLDQLAQDGHVTDDAGVRGEMRGDGGVLDQQCQRGGTADSLQRVAPPQLFVQRDEVDGLTAVEEAQRRLEDPAMRFRVEIRGAKQLDDARHRLAPFEERRAEDGALGVQIVRRDP